MGLCVRRFWCCLFKFVDYRLNADFMTEGSDAPKVLESPGVLP